MTVQNCTKVLEDLQRIRREKVDPGVRSGSTAQRNLLRRIG
jgi:hypothetical protein